LVIIFLFIYLLIGGFSRNLSSFSFRFNIYQNSVGHFIGKGDLKVGVVCYLFILFIILIFRSPFFWFFIITGVCYFILTNKKKVLYWLKRNNHGLELTLVTSFCKKKKKKSEYLHSSVIQWLHKHFRLFREREGENLLFSYQRGT
jgi:hypothetical protein